MACLTLLANTVGLLVAKNNQGNVNGNEKCATNKCEK
jgi:hypothetical protein